MSPLLEPSTKDEQPAPSASLIVSRVIVEAWLRSVDRKTGAAFLENLACVLADQEEMASVVPIRRTERGAAAARAEREALAALRQMLPVFIATLPRAGRI